MIRCSITGITTSESHRFSCTASRQPSGSNLRRSTILDSSSIASAMWANPQVWNSGAAMWHVHPRRSGILDSSATASSTPALLRGAPFGVPVVPEVRMMIRPCSSGLSSLASAEPFAMSFSTVVSPCGSPSVQATTRVTSEAFSSISLNSSSWITTVGPSRSRTSTSCGPANAVLR